MGVAEVQRFANHTEVELYTKTRIESGFVFEDVICHKQWDSVCNLSPQNLFCAWYLALMHTRRQAALQIRTCKQYCYFFSAWINLELPNFWLDGKDAHLIGLSQAQRRATNKLCVNIFIFDFIFIKSIW